MLETRNRESRAQVREEVSGWPAAVAFSPEQGARFAEQSRHHRDIWLQWIRLLMGGGLAAAGWLVWYALNLLAPPGAVDNQTNQRIQQSLIRIEAPMALGTLAVIATLTVAVSVAVRGLADPQSDSSQGIDEARRQFLTATAGVLGCIGVAIALLAVVWNVDSDAFGLPAAMGLLIIAAATSAIAADSMTVLGRAKSATPAFASWVREQEVDRIQRGAERARQEMYKVGRRERLAVVGKAAMVLIAAGLLLGAGLLAAFPGDLIHSFWSIPDRLWRSALGGLFVGGGVLAFGYRMTLHWLLREWWSVSLWIMMTALFALALASATVGLMAKTPDLVSVVLPPTLIGGPALIAFLMVLANFGPVRKHLLGRGTAWLVPDLRRLRGGELWRRVDNRRRANVKATSDSAPCCDGESTHPVAG